MNEHYRWSLVLPLLGGLMVTSACNIEMTLAGELNPDTGVSTSIGDSDDDGSPTTGAYETTSVGYPDEGSGVSTDPWGESDSWGTGDPGGATTGDPWESSSGDPWESSGGGPGGATTGDPWESSSGDPWESSSGGSGGATTGE